MRRVVITGLGVVCPLGIDVRSYWDSLLAGRSGIAPIELIPTAAFKVKIGGEVKHWKPEQFMDARAAHRLDRYAQFALVAAMAAVKDSGLDISREDPARGGTIVGSGIGGLTEYETQHEKYLQGGGPRGISPFVIPKMMPNSAAANISIQYGLCGPSRAVSTACASAADALADAMRCIQRDETDIMVAGGSEAAIVHMGLGGFISARALSHRNDDPPRASRPFDKDRDGFVLSEGSGILVLEEYEHARKRDARVYAELLGAGATADAYHITAPHPEGQGAIRSMQQALKDAHVNPADIQYVNAHGTSTEMGDAVETKAIKAVFGEHARRLAISSTKSMIGHLLGASGGVEAVATALTIRTGVMHPTINLQTPDPACYLDYIPNAAREGRVRRAISNSFGFGGHNTCLVLGAL